jgi:serine O-acetyltransferase
VVVFTGACVLGGVTVGERSEIGANCVVMKDIAPRMLVVPAVPRILPQAIMRSASKLPNEGEISRPSQPDRTAHD